MSNVDTKKLLEVLKSSSDERVELDINFFINIVEEIDKISGIKVEELYNENRNVYEKGDRTIINRAELLAISSPYNKLNGEVTVDAHELKAILTDNQKMINHIKELKSLNERLEKQLQNVFSNNKYEREHRRVTSCYNNNLNQNIKVNLKG